MSGAELDLPPDWLVCFDPADGVFSVIGAATADAAAREFLKRKKLDACGVYAMTVGVYVVPVANVPFERVMVTLYGAEKAGGDR